LAFWKGKLWASPRVFYAQGAEATLPLTIYAQDGEKMTFPTLPRQIFSGFVKRAGLDPLLGSGGYESGQGTVSGPTLATMTGQRLIEYQWPADTGPINPATGKPVNWDLRAPRDTNYSVNDPGHEWIGWTPRMINGVLEGRWTTDKVLGGGLILPDGVHYWPYMGTGPMTYLDQKIQSPRTYEYRYDPATYKFIEFVHRPEFADGPVLGQEIGPDGTVYLAHGGRGESSIYAPQPIAVRVYR
jgi:hypothetical protein